jgi:anti-sigma-K factor RskA
MNFSDPDLDELLGAYALHAVEPDERQAVKEYLSRSPRAAAEVMDHQLVATALAGSTHEVPAPSWDRINAAIDALDTTLAKSAAPVPPTTTLAPVVPIRSKRSWVNALAAVAAVAAIGLGITAVRQNSRVGNLNTELALEKAATKTKEQELAIEKQATKAKTQELKRIELQDNFNIERVIREPGSHVAQLKQGDQPIGQVLLDSKGRGFLIVNPDQTLPEGKAYQLWGVNGKSVISLGVMKSGVPAMPLSAAGDWSQFVLTVEDLPGVVTSDGPAVASGAFS